ncbi:hypothetical protein QJS66_21595 [Kocuria rhizophila]|nr:hypothetical protein QJS66_21595 [Kocuria rhizophila]
MGSGTPVPGRDLQHPRTVFQILKRHSPGTPRRWCGSLPALSEEDFDYLAAPSAENSGRSAPTCFAYAVG